MPAGLEAGMDGNPGPLEVDRELVDHLAQVGHDPESGARMLKRRIRSEVESPLASAMLKDEVSAGDRVKLGYDPARKALGIDKARPQGKQDGTQTGAGQAQAAEPATAPA
ncbi:MAG: ATP-dependent Clp protease ATP-binding subunit ClpA [Ramlibacter sp.]|jgi:ATP-dependent Clp protease ATP-binding subunit ClpC|nr:ATP-dependent Clp protease ATP-binding subunit ClpA [Ramlibacter sp.]